MKGRCTAVNGLSFRKGSRRTEVSSIKRQIPGPAFGSAKTDIGTTIVSMLEVTPLHRGRHSSQRGELATELGAV